MRLLENRIAELRKERHISQAELAEALEVTRQTINSLESGKYNASLLLAHKLARYFGLSIEDIFLFEEETQEEAAPKITMTAEDWKRGYWRNPYADEMDAIIHGEL